MSNVFFTSDLHLGHKKILSFMPNRIKWLDADIEDEVEAHTQAIISKWNERVSYKDKVFVLGDAIFHEQEKIERMLCLPGRKYLVRGNHDTYSTEEYLEVFEEVYGLHKQYHFWMSHAPIHPRELIGRINLHGHCHSLDPNTMGSMYYDVGVDAHEGFPVALDEIREHMKRFK